MMKPIDQKTGVVSPHFYRLLTDNLSPYFFSLLAQNTTTYFAGTCYILN